MASPSRSSVDELARGPAFFARPHRFPALLRQSRSSNRRARWPALSRGPRRAGLPASDEQWTKGDAPRLARGRPRACRTGVSTRIVDDDACVRAKRGLAGPTGWGRKARSSALFARARFAMTGATRVGGDRERSRVDEGHPLSLWAARGVLRGHDTVLRRQDAASSPVATRTNCRRGR